MIPNFSMPAVASYDVAPLQGEVPARKASLSSEFPTESTELSGQSETGTSLTDLFRGGSLARASAPTIQVTRSLVEPTVGQARHNRPVVLVHGTMSEASSIAPFVEPTVQDGHPTDLNTYLTIKEGDHLQESGQLISREVNNDRMQIARKNIQELNGFGGDLDKIQGFLKMGDSLYGDSDPAVARVASLLPDVIGKISSTLDMGTNKLRDSFSLRMKNIETDLAQGVQEAGFGSDIKDVDKRKEVCGKVAANVMDAIAPKVVLIGHSMGGFVSFIMAVNPKDKLSDKSPYSYDAGNGISTVITLSSPVKSGVKTPLPAGLTNYAYDSWQKAAAPMEGMPGMQFALMNPVFSFWYSAQKELSKQVMGAMTDASAAMTNPMTYAMKPGVEQISAGSDFIHKYLEGKGTPSDITSIAFTNKLDGISEADRSVMDDSQPNAFNVDMPISIPPEMLKKPGSTQAAAGHLIMSKIPLEEGEQCQKQLLENPEVMPKVLGRNNNDGVRYECLKLLEQKVKADPTYLDQPEMKAVVPALQEVASEKLPFEDSPSFLAAEILSKIGY